MFRCLSRCRLSLRINQARFMTTDPLLDQLKTCVGEDQVLQLIGKNKAKLSVTHVGYAINMLWHFQKEKANTQRTIDQIRNHPDFIALRILAENKIDLMDDNTLVETLYNMLRFNVEEHDSLIQQLVVEGWKRLEGFNLSELSKFSVCLTEQHMNTSPIIGQIASIVDKRLDDLQDARILSSLMVSICAVISQRLRDRLIEKAEFLMDGTGNCHFNQPRRIVQFLRNIKYTHRPLLEKCTQRFIQGINEMDPEILCIVIGLYQSLQFHNSDFRLMAKARLLEVIDQCHDIGNFTKLFATLGPMANQEIREKLEEDAMSVVDKMSPQQIMAILGTLEEMECRNTTLIQNITILLIELHYEVYRMEKCIIKYHELGLQLHGAGAEILSVKGKSQARSAVLEHFWSQSIENGSWMGRLAAMLSQPAALMLPRVDENLWRELKFVIDSNPCCSELNLSGTVPLSITIHLSSEHPFEFILFVADRRFHWGSPPPPPAARERSESRARSRMRYNGRSALRPFTGEHLFGLLLVQISLCHLYRHHSSPAIRLRRRPTIWANTPPKTARRTGYALSLLRTGDPQADHVAQYIAARIRKPLDKTTRNKLRAECPRPMVPDMARPAFNPTSLAPEQRRSNAERPWRPAGDHVTRPNTRRLRAGWKGIALSAATLSPGHAALRLRTDWLASGLRTRKPSATTRPGCCKPYTVSRLRPLIKHTPG
ncbi:FAST kinase domain-containing 1, mitochondrial [Pelobates cultripes]|uniref:FAST kinase domain-containing 1, mitochondrial n=1 Tax=Pelobates cultripes TaxID=61616 RepID=A0AAD1SQK0_PELCU|nr:FAST kinase domain-containing 1, mitochondrial [Pelobates cultripes]